MTPLFDWLDSAPANYVYLAIGVFLVILAVTEHLAVRWRT